MDYDSKIILEGRIGMPSTWEIKTGTRVLSSTDSSEKFCEEFENYEMCRKHVLKHLKSMRDGLGVEMNRWMQREHIKKRSH